MQAATDTGDGRAILFARLSAEPNMGSRLPIEVTSPTPEAMTALWEALCDDPMITDLPYKVETNQRGQLLMSPTSTPHSVWQGEFAYLLRVAVEAAALVKP
jgi:hypothetical protein